MGIVKYSFLCVSKVFPFAKDIVMILCSVSDSTFHINQEPKMEWNQLIVT